MSRESRVTILVDDTALNSLVAEHGLALWIETEGLRILFDTGQGGALIYNACQLGVDLEKCDALVLSHGHYDHTGALPQVLDLAGDVDLYAHRKSMIDRFSIREGAVRAIHIPSSSHAAVAAVLENRMHWLDSPCQLSKSVGLTGPIPRLTAFEDTGGPFFLDVEGKIPDPIEDDQALWIDTEAGLVICVGCSHAGVVNTVSYIRELNPGRPLRAVIGGFHLLNAGSDRLHRTAAYLKGTGAELVVPCHCTGEFATEMIGRELGDRCRPGHAGMVFLF